MPKSNTAATFERLGFTELHLTQEFERDVAALFKALFVGPNLEEKMRGTRPVDNRTSRSPRAPEVCRRPENTISNQRVKRPSTQGSEQMYAYVKRSYVRHKSGSPTNASLTQAVEFVDLVLCSHDDGYNDAIRKKHVAPVDARPR